MKRLIFILCVFLVVFCIVWLVAYMRKSPLVANVGYQASNRDGRITIYDISDLETAVSEIIPQGGFDYIRGGAGTEVTMNRNVAAFDDVYIIPRVLTGVVEPNLSVSILGERISLPVIAAPAAAHGLAHVSAEAGTARGVADVGTIMCVSNYASSSLEDIAQAGRGAPQWFQLYLSKDDNFNRQIIKKVEDLGYKAIVLTVDAPVGGNRVADLRNNFKFPLELPNVAKKTVKTKGQGINKIFSSAKNYLVTYDVMWVKSVTKLPVIVKGIQHPDDAEKAILAGADAVWVSNHGGRQLDGAPAAFEVLPEIAMRVNKRVPIIFDSGIRRGQHVFKAIASGADIVAIGRPVIYGLALGGWRGVVDVFDWLKQDLERVMVLAGAHDVEDIKNMKLHSGCVCDGESEL